MKSNKKKYFVPVFVLIVLLIAWHFFSKKIDSIKAHRLEYKQNDSSISTGLMALNNQEPESAETTLENTAVSTDIAENQKQEDTDQPLEKSPVKSATEYFSKDPLSVNCSDLERLFSSRLVQRLFNETPDSWFIKQVKRVERLSTRMTSFRIASKLPNNKKLLLLSEQESSGPLNQIEYASTLLKAKFELEKNLDYARKLENINYRTYMISLIVMEKPDLFGDASILKDCYSLEDTGNSLTVDEMNTTVEKVLQRAQVSAESIGFDSSWTSNLDVVITENGPDYQRGLLDKLEDHTSSE